MTPEQIKLVRMTLSQILDRKVETGRMFYDRLFTIAPRGLFKDDIDAQARKLMDTIAVAISSLRDPAALKTMLEDLGRRHVEYGAQDAHYDKVGEALLWTLEKVLGAAFTPQVREAWATLYGAVAATMKSGANGGTAAFRQSA